MVTVRELIEILQACDGDLPVAKETGVTSPEPKLARWAYTCDIRKVGKPSHEALLID